MIANDLHFAMKSSKNDFNEVPFLVRKKEAANSNRCGRVDNAFACWASIMRSNLTAAQVTNPLSPALYCLHEGCWEGKSAVCTVYIPIDGNGRCRTRHGKQVSVQVREPPWLWNPWGGPQGRTKSKIGTISGPTKWILVQQNSFFKKKRGGGKLRVKLNTCSIKRQ